MSVPEGDGVLLVIHMGERSVRGVGGGLSGNDHGGYNRAIVAEAVGARDGQIRSKT